MPNPRTSMLLSFALVFASALCAPLSAQMIRPKSRISVSPPDITDEKLDRFYSDLISRTIQDQVRRSGEYAVVRDMGDKSQNNADRVLAGRELRGTTKSSTIKTRSENAEDYVITADLRLFGQDFVLTMEIENVVTGDVTNTVVQEIKDIEKETSNPMNTTKVIEGTRAAVGKLLGVTGSSRLIGLKSDIESEFITFNGNGTWTKAKNAGYSIYVDLSRISEPEDLPNLNTGRLMIDGTTVFRLLDPSRNEVNVYNLRLENKSVVDIRMFDKEVRRQVVDKRNDILKTLLRGIVL